MSRYLIRIYDHNIKSNYIERVYEADDKLDVIEKAKHDNDILREATGKLSTKDSVERVIDKGSYEIIKL
ncbi:MAG: hypothetical protein OEV44_09290 [Spirochaetota bacterium]|nr:hypothetical protein [Spirochaetota bacterium]